LEESVDAVSVPLSHDGVAVDVGVSPEFVGDKLLLVLEDGDPRQPVERTARPVRRVRRRIRNSYLSADKCFLVALLGKKDLEEYPLL
jgi:hypothetical protein